MVNIDQIKQLREETGAPLSGVKKAIEESGGDMKKAKELLKIWGQSVASKKTGREAKQGIIDAYVHQNSKTGVILDIRCESDFVAKSKEFKNLAHEICLQITAMNPLFVSDFDIPEEFLDGEKKIYAEQIKDSGKPANIAEQIIEGKLQKYKESVSLLSQSWIKDDTKTIENLVQESVAKIGEKIEIKRFTRYEI